MADEKVNKLKQGIVPFTLSAIVLIAFVAVLYLGFIFPKTVAVWAEQGRVLSSTERLAVDLSAFCKQFGLVLMPLLLLADIGCAVWAVMSMKGNVK